jgi:ABC-type lipoprotein export system ATPase subunit
MDDLLVVANGASKVYGAGDGAVTALDDASFEVAPRRRIAIVGPSGSGKTTLLHLAAGLDTPSSGTVEWPAFAERESLRPRHVAMAFQGPSLIPALTVLENVAFSLLIAGEPESAAIEKADEMLERLSLSDLSDSMAEEISGGQLQRVAIARALVTSPALLLADEPTGQQDSLGSQRLMTALLAIVEEIGAALLVATHDTTVAKLLTTRWSIEDGQIKTG